jgi:3-phenylpropionate/cinnamic acid dioxygenase small subunit
MAQADGARLMVAVASLTEEVTELLAREAFCLDRRMWAEWLALYTDDAVYWAPALSGEDGFTSDPDNEISQIYLDRNGIEARIFRIEGGDSMATEPLPLTAHLVSNVLVHRSDSGAIEATATWLVHTFWRRRGAIVRGGIYEYTLRREKGDLRIVRKVVKVMDDRIVGPLDIYNI